MNAAHPSGTSPPSNAPDADATDSTRYPCVCGTRVAAAPGLLRAHLDATERQVIVEALAHTRNNQSQAARVLGISRRALIYKMERHGLKPAPQSDVSPRRSPSSSDNARDSAPPH